MNVIFCRITLEEPLLATKLEGDPNSSVSYSYIPGSLIRGVAVQKAHGVFSDGLDAAKSDVRSWFFNGQTRYLNAFPVHQEKRCLPVPRSWHRTKSDENLIFDFAVASSTQEATWHSIQAPFFTKSFQEKIVNIIKPEFQISVHNARNRRMGRAVDAAQLEAGEDTGAIYRYVALEAGQVFEAPVLCESDTICEQLLNLMNGPVKLGGSRTGGYGLAILESRTGKSGWREGSDTDLTKYDNHLLVTFLSDGLLRSASGVYMADPQVVREHLEQKLAAPLTLEKAFLTSHWIGGFNRAWGLPLPQSLALQMGSSFVFDATGISLESLVDLEINGLGDRTVEGFGRIGINLFNKPVWIVDQPNVEKIPTSTITIERNSPAFKTAERMSERLLDTLLDDAILKKSLTIAVSIKTPPPAQLNRLSLVLKNAAFEFPDKGCTDIKIYLENLGKRKSTRGIFEEDQINNTRLLDWLKETLSLDFLPQIWKMLDMPPFQWPSIGNVRVQNSTKFQYQTMIRFLIVLLGLAAKQKQIREKEN